MIDISIPYTAFIFGVICGMVGSWIVHAWVYREKE